MLTVVETDNRGLEETDLILNNGMKVKVNPKQLFIDMIENLPEKDFCEDLSIFDEMIDFLTEQRNERL